MYMKISTNIEQPLCSSISLELMLKESRWMGVGCYSSEAAGWASKRATVNLCSKGLARKENPPLRDIDLCPDKIFISYSNIGYIEFQSMGTILAVPWNPLDKNFTTSDYLLIRVWTQRENWGTPRAICLQTFFSNLYYFRFEQTNFVRLPFLNK